MASDRTYGRVMQTATALDLAGLPPGPGLAVALADVELRDVPNDRILDVLAAQHRQLCHEQARMAAVLAEVGRCTGHPEPGAVSRLATPERYASEETRRGSRRCGTSRFPRPITHRGSTTR